MPPAPLCAADAELSPGTGSSVLEAPDRSRDKVRNKPHRRPHSVCLFGLNSSGLVVRALYRNTVAVRLPDFCIVFAGILWSFFRRG